MSEAVASVKRRALGRGLSALIPQGTSLDTPAERRVPIADIRPNPRQPRRYFNEAKIAELAKSIQNQGILQPLLVRKVKKGYELILGERRFRAAQRAGLERIPVIVKEVSDSESLEMALVENIQREELTPIEEALAYRQLMLEFNLTQEQVAQRVGKSRPVVTNLLRVLHLPDEIKDEVDKGTISVGHARALLGLNLTEQQLEMSHYVIKHGLSVLETETLVAQSNVQEMSKQSFSPQKQTISTKADIYLTAVKEDLVRALGTKVNILPRKKGGRVEIEYYSNEELEGLVQRLKG